jgi:F-type H+-transporting ATPase subunit delta
MSETAPRQATVLDSRAATIAEVYAQALLDTLEEGRAAETAEELEALAKVLDEQPGAAEMLASAVSARQRRRQFYRIFRDRLSEPVEALVSAMSLRGRLGLLGEVAGSFRRLLGRRRGRLEATVTSAVLLDAEQRDHVREKLSAAFDAPVECEYRTDPSLLGGLRVQVGEEIFDGTLASRLRRVRRDLHRRGPQPVRSVSPAPLPQDPTEETP